jgi:uncharacterized protein DUF3891
MLVTRRGPALALVTHPDHGRVAGQLAERWGNGRFAGPEARAALVTAATHHDDGWAELDDRPAHNDEAARPAHFLELPLEQTVDPYRRGVDTVYERDPHAGALVSMHWAGLYSTRWGQQAGGPVGHPLAQQVVADEERRWVVALRESWDFQGLRSRFEADAWHAYEILQALDFIALALSLLDPGAPSSDGEPLPMPATLPKVDQPAGPRTIPAMPTCVGGEHVDGRLWIAGPGRMIIDPYPFAPGEIELEVPVRELEDRPYSRDEAVSAYHDAPVRQVPITVAATD